MESDYTPSKGHDMSDHDAAAVEAVGHKPCMYGIFDKYGKPYFDECCVGEHPDLLECDDEQNVLPLYTGPQVIKMADDLAALRARCEAAERDCNAAREAADSALEWFNRESEMRIKAEKERDAAIAAKEKAEKRLDIMTGMKDGVAEAAKELRQERDALQARVAELELDLAHERKVAVERANIVTSREESYALVRTQRDEAHAEVAKKDATIARLVGVLECARIECREMSDDLCESIDAAIAEVGT